MLQGEIINKFIKSLCENLQIKIKANDIGADYFLK